MRLHVSLNNEDGAHLQPQQQYQYEDYPASVPEEECYQYYQYPDLEQQQLQQQLQEEQYPQSLGSVAPSSSTTTTHQPYGPSAFAHSATSLSFSTCSFEGGSASGDTSSSNGGDLSLNQSQSMQPPSSSSNHHCIHTPVKNVRPMGTRPQHRGRVDPSRFKTEPCSYYLAGQECPFAPNCAFAHGETDKRSRRRNVREGITKVNTLPRTLLHHERWVQTTKYTRKTGPSALCQGSVGFTPSAGTVAPVPAPSFKKAA